ncbi:MAG: beta-ketoacyl synthase N-terminal-like domain-containing protein [Kofleriaceae bacterium]
MQLDLRVTAVGVVSPIGQGKAEFTRALLAGESAFGELKRPGRQRESRFLGAELGPLTAPTLSHHGLRGASLSAQAAAAVLDEVWREARLDEVAPERVGLVIGGSNVQQRELVLLQERHRERPDYLRPTYAMSFLDTDLCGFCTAHFGIRGPAFTVGGASASGQLAIAQAAAAVRAKQVDVCIALGALMDLSYWECYGFRAIGAMGSDRFAEQPDLACRPFDQRRDGFLFGESCAAIVLEAAAPRPRAGLEPYASLRGGGVVSDANRNANPSVEGERRAIAEALATSGWRAEQVDYLNPHGSGSPIGDATELEAIKTSGLRAAYLNTTKSLLGHGLSAAGLVEVAATLLQMRVGRLHPSRNLEEPIDEGLNWVRAASVEHRVRRALTLSFGFSGINTALCWESLS